MLIKRNLEKRLRHHLKRRKSILLLGPRQVGKTTLISGIKPELQVNLIRTDIRLKYEKDPSILRREILGLGSNLNNLPLVIIDEIQKVPKLMDEAQDLIDTKIAQFIFTGSSARKLRRGQNINLLPGRVVSLFLDPFKVDEFLPPGELEETILLDGSLPGVITLKDVDDRTVDLISYVQTYLNEEIRAEALVRDVGQFANFLELAGLESGNIINYTSLSQDLGVAHTTVANYFEILFDCLIADKIEPIIKSKTRKKLTKSSKFLFFDLGVRRICARQGRDLSKESMGALFEQFIGMELLRTIRLAHPFAKLYFWRDPGGPEVDWVIENEGVYTPIEVKLKKNPVQKDCRHLKTFMDEYQSAKKGYVVCQTEDVLQLDTNIKAISWKNLSDIF